MGMFDRILRAGEGRKQRALESLVPDINAFEPTFEVLSDDELRARTAEFRTELDNGADTNDLLIESFALVREAAKRTIGQRHFDVQLMGAAALHFGWVAEMKTGEGKTLVSTLPAYLNALGGHGVHMVTVNDYLARRDSEWMGSIHRLLGLDVGLIIPGQYSNEHKREQYAADITYGTNNEVGFDYLRDNMATSRDRQVQRGHHYAIVDEVDSILIDEARTPLIISGRMDDAADLYRRFAQLVRGMSRDVDYEVDEEKRTVAVLEPGVERVEAALGVDNLYDQVSNDLVHQLQAGLKAKELYRRDRDYVVQNGEVKIVDEFTGRILEGRRWSEGLHQAVEAKEGVKVKEENQTLATITLQNYFRLYEKLAGMTGTATTEAAEFANTYGLDVVPIPTHKPLIRLDQGDLIFKGEDAKFDAVIDDLKERHEDGQPILIGTASVEKSEKLSRLMEKEGIAHNVLNAKQHTREAEIVAQAGRLRAVTVATNMAGRGVDIILGGNPEALARQSVLAEGLDPTVDEGQSRLDDLIGKFESECLAEGEQVRDMGGLYVLGTERHESRRIDNQLRGRSGRQGDPGESRFYLSLEDDLMRLFATGAMNWVMDRALPDDVPIEAKMVTRAIERAQNTVEQRNAEIRKNVLKYDEVMNEQRKVIYARRDQILDGTDLREESLRYLRDAVETTVDTYCPTDYPEEWDVEGLLAETRSYWPTALDADAVVASGDTGALVEHMVEEGTRLYEEREEVFGKDPDGDPVMRQVERVVMLRIIDQRWREHLREMDYLRDGIGLRAMGQRDPLTEWQREGFDMFGAMMKGISQDYVRYVMHVDVQVRQEEKSAEPPSEVSYTAPADPDGAGEPTTARPAAAAAGSATATAVAEGTAPPAQPTPSPTARQQPVTKSAEEKLGRNDPCWCGSGKKYKNCHLRRA